MLTEAERQAIEQDIAVYPDRRAGCVEALKIVQRRRGWVSDEDLRQVAAWLGMTAEELDAVATFYNLIFRKPVGRHVILACDSVSCWIMGCDAVRERLCARLGVPVGGTTPDGRFTLLPIVCLGACDRAPVVMVDDDLHAGLAPDAVDRVLERYQ